MLKEWFISINGVQEGPYTVLELHHHMDVTPDTLVWKEGFSAWIPIRDVPELKDVFKDDPESVPLEDLVKEVKKPAFNLQQDQDTLTIQHDPVQFFLWLLVIILFILYFLLQFNRN